MKNITFGYLLEKLLYFSKQKKTALARELGYDVSYISKWTSGKNLPIPKNINEICEITSTFITNSLTEETTNDLKEYFEIEKNIDIRKDLEDCLGELLKEAYIYTSQKSIPIQSKEVYREEDCNGIIHVNPKLRKQYLDRDIEKYISKSNTLNLIVSINLNKIGQSDKISIADIKEYLYNKREDWI